jgi:3-hydroxyisobutyrate dehydrogenase
MTSRKVTFLGLGAMGSRMAANLVRAGHAVTVWNRTPRATEALAALGAHVAATPRAAAEGAEFVISMVTNDAASAAVWLDPNTGALGGLGESAIALESSTVTPQWIEKLSAAVTARGARFLDAPVSGSLPQAEARQLIVMVGGDTAAFQAAAPVLSAIAGAIYHVGPKGQGIALKLAVNALLGIQVAAYGELLGYLSKSGLAPSHALDLLSKMPMASASAIGAAKLMVARDFAPRFPVDLIAKDFGYAIDSAGNIGADVPVTEATRTQFEKLRGLGFGAENMTAVMRLFSEAG